MTATKYDPAELIASLKQYAREGTETAALGLLEEHDYWLRRIAYHHPQFVMVDGAPYRLDWIELSKAFGRGELRASTTETTILHIALSLQVFGFGVNLGDVLPSLGRANTRSVMRAVATATGHSELVVTRKDASKHLSIEEELGEVPPISICGALYQGNPDRPCTLQPGHGHNVHQTATGVQWPVASAQ